MNIESAIERYSDRLEDIIERNMTKDEFNYLVNIYTNQIKEIKELKKKIRNLNKKVSSLGQELRSKPKIKAPISKRVLKSIVYDNRDLPKIFLNAITGEVTLKVPKQTTPPEEELYVYVTKKIMQYKDFFCYTYRGVIHYEYYYNSFIIKMHSSLEKIVISLQVPLKYKKKQYNLDTMEAAIVKRYNLEA